MKNIIALFRNLYFLFFICGFFLTSTVYLKIESQYEDQIFSAIVSKILTEKAARNNTDTFFKRSIEMTNFLISRREVIFGNYNIEGIKANLLHSSSVDLMTGNGACGSASVILARILKAYNYKIRIAQMKVGNVWGGHIVIEAKKTDGWVVMDPHYGIYYKKPDGKFASFKDVQNNWDFYKKQTPRNYKQEYRYEGVHYTNWEKMKIAGPIIKNVLNFLLGKEKGDEICLRSYLLRPYNILFGISGILFILVSIQIIILFVKKKSAS